MILRHDQLKIEVDADGAVRLDCSGPVTEDGLLWLVAIGGPAALGHARRAHGRPADVVTGDVVERSARVTYTDIPAALDG